jgi:hypothetical protein
MAATARRQQGSFDLAAPIPDSTIDPARPDPLDLLGSPPEPVDLLPHFADYVEERRSRNLDTYIVCTGREGWGKSSLGLTAALELDPTLSPEDVIFTEQDYRRVYDPDAREQVYVFDEAGRLFFNRESMTRAQRLRIQEVMENRQMLNTYFLHLPQAKVLDKYMRGGRIELWFACKRQGVAMIRKLNYNAYEEKAYYPIKVDEHFWDPLEETYPSFAEEYYRLKDNKHTETFYSRQRESAKKRDEEAADEDHKEARRQAILDGDG